MILKDSFIKMGEEILDTIYDDNYKSRKRNEIDYLTEILKSTHTTSYWSRYIDSRNIKDCDNKISGKLLNKKHIEYIKNKVYDKIYEKVLTQYIKLTKYNSFLFLSSDTSFIYNKCCKGLPRNKFYKSRKGLKLSSIVDSNGIPLSFLIKMGNVSDHKILIDTYENLKVNPVSNDIKKKIKNKKQYFMCDAGYDSNEIRTYLQDKTYNVIVPYNNRRCKDEAKKKTLTKDEKIIYKKRIIIENYFSWMEQYPKISTMNERNIKHYEYLVILASINKIFTFIDNIIKK
jgi:hypothetical protein